MKSLVCKCLCLLFLLAFPLAASNHEKLSQFEKEVLQKALKKYDIEIDNSPENKKIRNFYYYTEDPFLDSDKAISWLNKLQFKTKDSAIRNQLWIHPGDSYNSNVLIQNEQALLNPLVRSFALLFPVQKVGDISDSEVDLLVVTKDIFSWQGNSLISMAGGALANLSVGFSQSNLFGLNKTLGVNFSMDQALINPSVFYDDPALFSSKNQLTLSQGIFFERSGLAYTGFNGSALLTYPLGTQNTPWSYSLSNSYTYQPVYDYQGTEIRTYQGYKRQYRAFQISPEYTVTRSFGSVVKNNLSFGYGLNLNKYTPLEPVSNEFIKNVLPYSELQSFLILGYNYFQNHYLALYDYNTFAMTEWAQLDPSLSLTNNIALATVLGSDHTFYQPVLSLGATASPTKTSLVSASTSFQTRVQDQFLNNQFSANFRVVFPTITPVGRFVLAATYANSWKNLNNTNFYLGGSSGLRGVPYRYYQGTQLLSHNLEFRTRSVPFWIFRLGLAAFQDFGCAFNNSSDFNPTYDAGLGLRILVIPWNRLVLRIDAATPIWGPIRGIENTLVTVGFGQAF